MCYITSKVFADDDMPCWTMSSVKLFLDLRGNVLLDGELFQRGQGDFYALMLHLVCHVDIFDNSLVSNAVATNSATRAGVY